MSVQLIAWAYDQKVGSASDKAVLLALANASNHHTGKCSPRIDRLAEETELGESTVRKSLASLEHKGIITRDRIRAADGSYRGYHYSFPHLLAASSPPLRDSGSPPLPDSGQVQPEVVLEPEETLAAAPRERPRNEIWDALGEIFGEPSTRSAVKVRGKVCSELRDARAGPDEIFARARRWKLHYNGATMTDLALAKHWDTLERNPLR